MTCDMGNWIMQKCSPRSIMQLCVIARFKCVKFQSQFWLNLQYVLVINVLF
jgi:hypothetical protein